MADKAWPSLEVGWFRMDLTKELSLEFDFDLEEPMQIVQRHGLQFKTSFNLDEFQTKEQASQRFAYQFVDYFKPQYSKIACDKLTDEIDGLGNLAVFFGKQIDLVAEAGAFEQLAFIESFGR